jgi:hydrogenase expression/formation protein HypC
MCLAIPGKIISIDKDEAVIDFSGAKKTANISLVDVKVDDWVMVHAGFAIEKIEKDEANEINSLIDKSD